MECRRLSSPLSALLPVLGFSLLCGCATGVLPEGAEDNNTNNTMTNNRPNNQRPVAAPGMSQSVNVGDMVQLDGSASVDPDGDGLTFAWTLQGPEGSAAALADAAASQTTFVPDVPGLYIATLVVNDGLLESAAAAVKITAEEQIITDNKAPTAIAGVDRKVQRGMLVTLDGSASSDPDGDALTYEWSMFQRPGGSLAKLNNPTTVNPSFTVDQVGEYRISLVVRDGVEASAPALITITGTDMAPENQAPVAMVGSDQSVKTGTVVQLDGTGSADPDQDVITYMWSLTRPGGSNATLSSSTSLKPVFTPDVEGNYVATLVVSDGRLTSDPKSTTIVVVNDNNPPTADAGNDRNVDVGTLVTLNGLGSADPDGNALTYAWSLTTPGGSSATLNDPSSPTPQFTPDVAGGYFAKLVVSDGKATSEDTVAITAQATNRAPTANGGADRTVSVGSPVSLDGTGSSDPDGDSLTYAWSFSQKPAGSTASISGASSANASFTPDVAGVYRVNLSVNDGQESSLPDLVIVTATGSSLGCLIISEYVEGSSQNKGIELFNCGSSSIDLSRYGVCLVQNAGPDCDRQIMLTSGNTLAAGSVLTIGRTDATISALSSANITSNSVMDFNGNDRLFVFYDDDQNGTFTDGVDTVVDAFGERNLGGGTTPSNFASDVTLRRCNFSTYSGIGAFTVLTYYSSHTQDDVSNFGTPPTQGCP